MTKTQSLPGVGHDRPAAADELNDEINQRSPQNRSTGRLMAATGALAAVAAAAVLFMVVKPSNAESAAENSAVPEATETTEAPTTTTAPAPTTTAVPAPAAPAAPPVADLPEFPAEMPLTHGSPAWGVYLAVSAQPGSPELEAAQQSIIDAGYAVAAGTSSAACDAGAPEALGVSGDANTVAAYFDIQEKAEQAEAAFLARGQEVRAVVQVVTYCLD